MTSIPEALSSEEDCRVRELNLTRWTAVVKWTRSGSMGAEKTEEIQYDCSVDGEYTVSISNHKFE